MRCVGIAVVFVAASVAWNVVPAVAASHPLLTVKPAISVGDADACGLSTGGTVDCWGNNSTGQLGNDSTANSVVPVRVHGVNNVGFLSGVTAISTSGAEGADITCALLASGTVDCWGSNSDGQLGQGTTTGKSLVPVPVDGVGGVGVLSGVTAITTAGQYACALLSWAGTVDCWGQAMSGKSPVPIPVPGVGGVGLLSGVSAISGGFQTMCALLADGTVDCWGYYLEDGSTFSVVPVQIQGLRGVGALSHALAISVGLFDPACAVVAPTRAVECWGLNINFDLGNNSARASAVPVLVRDVKNVGFLHGVSAITLGETNACAVLSAGGTVDCWGDNSAGQMGIHTIGGAYEAVQVHGVGNHGVLSHATAIAMGTHVVSRQKVTVVSACALLTDGTVDCWGKGDLGNDSTTGSSVPIEVHGVSNHGFLVL
jgi:alpha-tubulin suppressor-like RCC1 family protein